ncbi:hypothetical protein NX059_012422 [Plenodomus lindquistii]|nr:hypothetical protein NX059_012422 [Plenodomus lindquistii]
MARRRLRFKILFASGGDHRVIDPSRDGTAASSTPQHGYGKQRVAGDFDDIHLSRSTLLSHDAVVLVPISHGPARGPLAGCAILSSYIAPKKNTDTCFTNVLFRLAKKHVRVMVVACLHMTLAWETIMNVAAGHLMETPGYTSSA